MAIPINICGSSHTRLIHSPQIYHHIGRSSCSIFGPQPPTMGLTEGHKEDHKSRPQKSGHLALKLSVSTHLEVLGTDIY